MRYTIQLINDLANLTGKNAKQEFIRVNSDNSQFLELLKYAFDPYKVYGIKKVEYTKSNINAKIDNHKEFINLLEYLMENNTNDVIRQQVTTFINKCDALSQPVYSAILSKKLTIGVTGHTINKALEREFIPLFKAMKPYSYSGEVLTLPTHAQEKMDGVRCIIRKLDGKVDAFTYNGSKLVLPNIFKSLTKLPTDNFVLDSELLNSGNRLKTTGIVNKILKGNKEPDLDKSLDVYVFDLLTKQEWESRVCTRTSKERHIALDVFVKNSTLAQVKLLPLHYIKSLDTLKDLFKQVVAGGGEGLIIKKPEGVYEWKRSKNWLKWKQQYSTTLEVVGMEEGEGKYINKLGALVCQSSDGIIKTNLGTGFSDELRKKYWELNITGSFVEVLFNELQYTTDNEPYLMLPVFKEVRIDKEEADSFSKILEEVKV